MVTPPERWPPDTRATLARKLLAWFDAEQRALPWRRTRDAYPVWVSEVMLQQTTVAVVVSYFERFLAAYPTVTALAAAPEQDVLTRWAGLGYYRRARHLHAAAKRLAGEFGDQLPDDPAVWAELPGVGRYILGAVLSQAFERRLPVVEANTLRVISRLLGSRLDPREGAGQKWVWLAAEWLLPDERLGDFNQAMMELGATVCTPSAPRCPACPVREECEANRLRLQAEIPPPPRAKVFTKVEELALLLRQGDRTLWGQRPQDAKRWAGMWEVPHGEQSPGETPEQSARRLGRELLGCELAPGPELHRLDHGVTRFKITLKCHACDPTTPPTPTAGYPVLEWLTLAEAKARPISSPQRALATALERGEQRLF